MMGLPAWLLQVAWLWEPSVIVCVVVLIVTCLLMVVKHHG